MYRNIKRELQDAPDLRVHFSDLLSKAKQLMHQKRNDINKLYSLHAPEVECIAKGKANKKYEFGSKVSIATTNKSNFVVGIQSLDKNQYDGHSLNEALEQVKRLNNEYPKKVFVDQGYRGHGVEGLLRRDLKRRSAI